MNEKLTLIKSVSLKCKELLTQNITHAMAVKRKDYQMKLFSMARELKLYTIHGLPLHFHDSSKRKISTLIVIEI